MPYRPEELMERRIKQLHIGAEVERLSACIDEEMLESYNGGVFRYSALSCLEPVLVALRTLYRDHGWHVSWEPITEPHARGWMLTFEPLRVPGPLKWKAAR